MLNLAIPRPNSFNNSPFLALFRQFFHCFVTYFSLFRCLNHGITLQDMADVTWADGTVSKGESVFKSLGQPPKNTAEGKQTRSYW